MQLTDSIRALPPNCGGNRRIQSVDCARAGRLLRWYPASWRARYGAEFAELLIADLGERPRCGQRTADIARSGLAARLAAAGLASHPLDQAAAGCAGLATLACSAAAFIAVGTAMSSQLVIGLQWSAPGPGAGQPGQPAGTHGDLTAAIALMSGALLAFTALALLAAAPVLRAAIRACARGGWRELRRPTLLIVIGAVILVVGGRHFGNGWPGTGGNWWAAHGIVPSGVAAFGWAATMSITSYWAHPGLLAAFPAAELAWLVISPAAATGVIFGLVQVLRRIDLPHRVLRYEAGLAGIAAVAMAAFFAGALSWVTAAGPQRLTRPGTIDVAGLALLAIALATAAQAGQRAFAASRAGRVNPAGPAGHAPADDG